MKTDYELVTIVTDQISDKYYLGIVDLEVYRKRKELNSEIDLNVGNAIICKSQHEINKILPSYMNLFSNCDQGSDKKMDFDRGYHFDEEASKKVQTKFKKIIFSESSVPLERIVSVNEVQR